VGHPCRSSNTCFATSRRDVTSKASRSLLCAFLALERPRRRTRDGDSSGNREPRLCGVVVAIDYGRSPPSQWFSSAAKGGCAAAESKRLQQFARRLETGLLNGLSLRPMYMRTPWIRTSAPDWSVSMAEGRTRALTASAKGVGRKTGANVGRAQMICLSRLPNLVSANDAPARRRDGGRHCNSFIGNGMTCIYTYMNASMQTCIHTYMHASTHPRIYTFIHAYMHSYMYGCIHAFMHIGIHTCIYTYMHAHMHLYKCACMRVFIQICMYIHAFMHAFTHPCIYE
jgi:hypothetical protein